MEPENCEAMAGNYFTTQGKLRIVVIAIYNAQGSFFSFQIFPQVAAGIIQRTVEQAKANEGVDILTHCIEVVLAYQEAGNQNQLYDSRPDDVVFIGVRKREKSNGLTKDIPCSFRERWQKRGRGRCS